MTGISVNLLPEEIILQRRQSFKLTVVNRISIALLAALIFLTSATMAVRILQNSKLQQTNQGLAVAEGQVKDLQGKEQQAVALKQRLVSISSLLGADKQRREIFNLIVALTPPDLQITEALVDRNGNMTVSLSGGSLTSIQTLLADLSSKEKNADLISKISLEGLSVGKDSIYRFTLKITAKGK